MFVDYFEQRVALMKKFWIYLAFIMCLFVSSLLNAQIYSWTDENGVKHYSNIPPTRGRTNPARRERVGCPFESQMGRHEESTKTE